MGAIDPALGTTGLVGADGEPQRYRCKLKDEDRLLDILEVVDDRLGLRKLDAVGIEGYAHGRANRAHQMGELGGLLRVELHLFKLPFIVVPPSTLKKFATGKGNAGKPEVLIAAVKRLGYEGTDDNEADALWIWHIVMALAGHQHVALPKAHLEALDKLTPRKAFAWWVEHERTNAP